MLEDVRKSIQYLFFDLKIEYVTHLDCPVSEFLGVLVVSWSWTSGLDLRYSPTIGSLMEFLYNIHGRQRQILYTYTRTERSAAASEHRTRNPAITSSMQYRCTDFSVCFSIELRSHKMKPLSCAHTEWNHCSITALSLLHQRKIRKKMAQRS